MLMSLRSAVLLRRTEMDCAIGRSISWRRSPNQRCSLPSMCSIIPGSARRGRRLRCAPGFFRLITGPASSSAVVTELYSVHLAQLLVKVLHVEVEVLSRYSLQHLLKLVHLPRFGLGRRLRWSIPAVVVLPVPFAPAPHCPMRHPDDLGRFPPLQLARHRFQCDFLNLHHPLQFSVRNLLFDRFHVEQFFPPAPQADNSLAN